MLKPLFPTIDGVVQLQPFWDMEHGPFWDLLALLYQDKIANDHGELVAMKAAILQIPITLTAKRIDDFEDYSNKIDNVFAAYCSSTRYRISPSRDGPLDYHSLPPDILFRLYYYSN